jgi:DNA-binding IclR family transcriptional regulator
MSRSSPGVRRVAAILNFIADHPGQAFALTDLVRALKLSRATCHALLTGLVDVGYLYRTSDKTYVLGPSLAAIGRTAADQFSPLQIAQPEMRAIADEFDVVCGAYFLEGDAMLLRDRAASLSHVGYPVPLGTRIPLRPALAAAFFSCSAREAQAWLARARPAPEPDQVAQMEAAMAFARDNGFVVQLRKPDAWSAASAREFMPPGEIDEPPIAPLTEIAADAVLPVAAIMAPVRDGNGATLFVLVMAGFDTPLVGARVIEAGEQLAAACRRVSGFVAGRLADGHA